MKMGVRNHLSFSIGVIFVLFIYAVSAQREIPKITVLDGGLSPPYFNLADNRRIYASGTYMYFILNCMYNNIFHSILIN